MVRKVILLFFAAILCAGCGGGSVSRTANNDLVRSAPGDAEVQGIVEGWLATFVPFTPYSGTAEWPPPYGMSQCRFTHGRIQVRRIDHSLLEAEFDYSGKVTFSSVPEWEETATGRAVLEIVPAGGRWTCFGDFRSLQSREVFGRPSDGVIPEIGIGQLLINGSEQPEDMQAASPLSIEFSVGNISGEWVSALWGDARICSVDPTVQVVNQPGWPTISGNAFLASTSAPYELGRYWVVVSAASAKRVDGCPLMIGTRASASRAFSVTKPAAVPPPGEDPPGGDPPPPPGP